MPPKKQVASCDVIHNETCVETMRNRISPTTIDLVITSPPYNTSRAGTSGTKNSGLDTYQHRYNSFDDSKSDEEYIEWTIAIFREFDTVLKPNAVVLYNMSYSADRPALIWKTIAAIIDQTSFTTVDTIAWKKSTALPNNTSMNRLTRIVEFVFVFARKSEQTTFTMCKPTTSRSVTTGQQYFGNVYNLIEAPNNDGPCAINKATFSSALVSTLLQMYLPKTEEAIVYDPFMGTGTTAVACKRYGCHFIGSEISNEQCNFAQNRLRDVHAHESVEKKRKR